MHTITLCVMYVLCVLLINGAVILLLVHMWCVFFSTTVICSDVDTTGSWQIKFGYVYFVTIVRQSDVEPPGSWWLDYAPLFSWLVLGIVSPIPWLIGSMSGSQCFS